MFAYLQYIPCPAVKTASIVVVCSNCRDAIKNTS